jgi:hypothetical protein
MIKTSEIAWDYSPYRDKVSWTLVVTNTQQILGTVARNYLSQRTEYLPV